MGLFKKKKEPPVIIKCPYCDLTTTDYNALKKHVDWAHPKEKLNG